MATRKKGAGDRSAPAMDPRDLLDRLVGRWAGVAKTWFEPGAPAETSSIAGSIRPAVHSASLNHTYRTRVQGRAARGLALIGRDLSSSRFCVSWVDTFHTGDDVMLFRRDDRVVPGGFSVVGEYAVGPEEPRWGWRTTYQLKGPQALEIVHYNITPDGFESRAILISYTRSAGTRGPRVTRRTRRART